MSRLTPAEFESLDRRPTRWAWGGLCLWVLAVGGGWGGLTHYANRPGSSAAAPTSVAQGESHSQPFHLMLFVHPRCPCSAASVRELSRIMAQCSKSLRATVYFYRPETQPDEWARSPLWKEAAAIPGVRPQVDVGGRAAREYGSLTSGDTLLYDPSGRLRFHGGITFARGHEGDSKGKLAVIAHVRGEATEMTESPVFGCLLRVETVSRQESQE